MLEARKSRWFEEIFALYNHNLFKRRFHSLRISGLTNIKDKNLQIPLIIYANHSSWWDGLTVFEIARRAKLDSYVMMEEKQLRKLGIFRRLGAFSVARENPREAIASLNYAVRLLMENSRRTLWIFPQGEILPNDLRPLNFYHGLARIIEKTNRCVVLPCALRYEFLGNFKPGIFVKIGIPKNYLSGENLQAKKLTAELAKDLELQLDELKNDILTMDFQNYENIF